MISEKLTAPLRQCRKKLGINGAPYDILSAESEYWKDIANTGFSAALKEFEAAYTSKKDDSDAIEYLEDLAVPAFRKYRDWPTDREPQVQLLSEIVERHEDIDNTSIFRKEIDEPYVASMRGNLESDYDKDEFDYVVGVFSSGIPFLYAATSYIDAEEVILRYSQSRDDNEVLVTTEMRKRSDFEDSKILLVDDGIITGGTLRNVGRYLLNEDADEVLARCLHGKDELGIEMNENNEVEIGVQD